MATLAERVKYQEDRFLDLADIVGRKNAIFFCCAVYNVPYAPKVDIDDWTKYREYIDERYKGRKLGFENGLTDIREFLSTDNERTAPSKWEAVWGEGDEENPYTEKDYERLDELFAMYSARLQSAGGYDVQQEDTLRFCSKMRLLADKLLAKGDKDSIDMASKLSKMIQENLSSENLRRKDEKPIETAKFDGIVDKLRKKYGADVELTRDQAVEICCQWLQEHRYPMTMDAAEHALLAIINTTRLNNDEIELDELPADMRFKDSHRKEFAEIPTTMEDEAYEYLGITRRR